MTDKVNTLGNDLSKLYGGLIGNKYIDSGAPSGQNEYEIIRFVDRSRVVIKYNGPTNESDGNRTKVHNFYAHLEDIEVKEGNLEDGL